MEVKSERLTVHVSRKGPISGVEYGSQGYTVGFEAEMVIQAGEDPAIIAAQREEVLQNLKQVAQAKVDEWLPLPQPKQCHGSECKNTNSTNGAPRASRGTITDKQLSYLYQLVEDEEDLCSAYHVDSIEELSKEQASEAIDRLKQPRRGKRKRSSTRDDF